MLYRKSILRLSHFYFEGTVVWACFTQYLLKVNVKIPKGKNCHDQKVYGIFPIWHFVLENSYIIYIIFIPTQFGLQEEDKTITRDKSASVFV